MQPASGPRSAKRRQIIVLSVFLLVVAAIGVYAWTQTRHNGSNAKVGDCVTQSGDNSVKIVDCSDRAATLKVVGRVGNKTRTEAQFDACDAFPTAEQVYWNSEDGTTGQVLCLAPNTP